MGCRGPIQPAVHLSFTGLKDNVRDWKYSWPYNAKRRKTGPISYNTCCIHTKTYKILKFVGSAGPDPVPLTERLSLRLCSETSE